MVSVAFQISTAITSTLYVAVLSSTNLAFRADQLEPWQWVPGWVASGTALIWIVILLMGKFLPDASQYVTTKPPGPWHSFGPPPRNALTYTRFAAATATVGLGIVFAIGN